MDMRNYISLRGSTYWIDTYIKPMDSVRKVRVHRSLKTKNFKEAISLASKLVNETQEKPVQVIQKERDYTLGELILRYMNAKQDIKPSTLEFYKHISKPLTAYFGEGFRVAAMTIEKVAGFRVQMDKDKRAQDTQHHILAYLKSLYRFAHQENIIQQHILQNLKIRGQRKKEVLYFTESEVEHLLAVIDDANYPPTYISLNTGMRKNEVLNMRFTWIDFEKGYITIPAEYTKGNYQRDVPLSDDLRDYLKKRKDMCSIHDGYVVSRDGGMTRYENVKWGFRVALKTIGREDCNFHVCRKTYATHYLQENPNDYYGLMQICGWRDIKTAMKYAKETPQYLAEKRQRVNALYKTKEQPKMLLRLQA